MATAATTILNGGAGADAVFGGLGNEAYFVESGGDVVVENPNEGNDTVYASVDYGLTPNVENLILQGGADLQGYGNGLVNAIFGNSGADLLDGGAGSDVLTGGAGNDVFVFHAGEANGDTVVDFNGSGAGAGDSLQFVGYGAGATFSDIDATHWQVNYNGGTSHDMITFSNGASVHPTDYGFI